MSRIYLMMAFPLAFLLFSSISCSHDEITPDPVNNSVDRKFMFCYNKDDRAESYCIRGLGTSLGSAINCSTEYQLFNGWDYMAGIQSDKRQFVIGHNMLGIMGGSKDWEIRELLSYGELGERTDYGDSYGDSWEHNYETFFGFRLGTRGFLFGQDSYGDHRWFVQEVLPNGKLADGESDSGNWNNYYGSATPLYVNGQTFIFFQTDNDDKYWFISRVSQDGKLSDVCDGKWGYFWDALTSVESGGTTYLVGNRRVTDNYYKGEYFIQAINSDGTMGAETDRGWWNYHYHIITGYTYGDQAYIFGHNALEDGVGGGLWFIQEVTSDGKLGTETSHGTIDANDSFFFPFNLSDPGALRYTIGWDLSATTGSPTRSWSPLYMDPWSGETKYGGGAALAQIDKDAGGRLDAVLVGIQNQRGDDRFYYKVAWNLDGTGKASSWSQDFFGPSCAQFQSGGGADISDIDENGMSDLLLMWVDNPAGANFFRYNIGWNLGTDGQAGSWSAMIQGPSLGDFNSGGGAALGDIDRNGRPEVVFMGIDNPDQANSYWYVIGKNLNKAGIATSWTQMISAPCDVGWNSAGGGAALADINGNGKPDLVLMNIDSPDGANVFWCYVGWDIDINGNVTGWSSFTGPVPGNLTCGGGTAIADINKNGILDLLLMSVDDPYENN